MSPSSRKMAYVEFSKPKQQLIPKEERKRQEASLRTYKIGGSEDNEKETTNENLQTCNQQNTE